MKEVLDVLLVEDDVQMCDNIIKYCKSVAGIDIVKVTDSSDTAFNFATTHKPSAIILDLELQQGSGDGIMFLNRLKDFSRIYKPYIVITTNNLSTVTYEQARKLGTDYIFSKYSTNYSHKTPIDFLNILKNTILKSQASFETNEENMLDIYKEELKAKISLELDYVGISHKVLGYKYLFDAILMQLTEENIDNYVTCLSEKYQKSSSSIIRAMQTAIERAWKVSCIENLFEHYTARINPLTGVPTVTEFISYYTDKLDSQL